MVFNFYGLSDGPPNSLDHLELQNLTDPQILEESLSMPSLSSLSSVSSREIPLFPSRNMIPMSPILLDDHSPMFPTSRDKASDEHRLMITLTVPTSPRMKKMLTESLCVDKWVENLTCSCPPGHTPWGEVMYEKHISWIPEGSMYPPEAFNKALSTVRHSRKVKCHLATPFTPMYTPALSKSGYPTDTTSFRKALVFEREITLCSGGKTKRWSLKVPATSMNPEMVDMMLELQDLNSFFKDSLDDLDQSVAILDQEKEKLEPPSLMVSDSHCALPVSLESSENLNYAAPVPLAARRGKVTLPPISIKPKALDPFDPYPSIPTAFLGSPSTYSPKFEFANTTKDPALGLEDMVTNLRFQCASIQSDSRTDIGIGALCTGETGENDVDDWAFADTLLNAFSASPTLGDLDTLTAAASHQQAPETGSDNDASCTATAPSIAVLNILPQKVAQPSPILPSAPPSFPPPSTPLLPSRPSLAIPSPSPREVRGILKSCKNVRFASLPGRQRDSVDGGPPMASPRHSAGSTTAPQRPSRLYTACLSKNAEAKESSPPSIPHSSLPAPTYRITRPDAVVSSPPVTVFPSTLIDGSPTKKFVKADRVLRPRSHTTISIRRSNPVPINRHSLKPGSSAEGKENEINARRISFTTRPAPTSRWTMNEMPFRRVTNTTQSPEDTPRSRMPVPLRNILTRFK